MNDQVKRLVLEDLRIKVMHSEVRVQKEEPTTVHGELHTQQQKAKKGGWSNLLLENNYVVNADDFMEFPEYYVEEISGPRYDEILTGTKSTAAKSAFT